jgi:hypothetical protein
MQHKQQTPQVQEAWKRQSSLSLGMEITGCPLLLIGRAFSGVLPRQAGVMTCAMAE